MAWAYVQRVLNPFVGQPKAVLRDGHPEHALQPDGRAASVALGVVRLDHRHQLRPGGCRLDLGQKALTSGLLLLGDELEFGKARLGLHGHLSPGWARWRDCAKSRGHASIKSAVPLRKSG